MTYDDVGSGGKGDKGRRTILAAAVEEDLGRVLVKCRRGLPGTATAGSDEKSLRCASTPKLVWIIAGNCAAAFSWMLAIAFALQPVRPRRSWLAAAVLGRLAQSETRKVRTV
jgi:hypothetical protein